MKWIMFTLILVLSFPHVVFTGDMAVGENLFKRKCKSCHRLSDGVKVGPGLAGVTRRRTEEWLHEWLKNPKAMINKGDPIAVKLKKKFKKTMRKMKPMQDEKNRQDIISFLKENDRKLEEQQ